MNDSREGSERQGRFMEAIEAVKGSSKLAALDRAYHKAIESQDSAEALVDVMASVIYVRDLLANERT